MFHIWGNQQCITRRFRLHIVEYRRYVLECHVHFGHLMVYLKLFDPENKRTRPEALESLGQSDGPFRLQGQIRKIKEH